MPGLTFFRQARVDGGIRTGIDVNGEALWRHFQPGDAESDPILRWYVDVRCEGEALPHEREAARRWFCDQGPVIKAALEQLADNLCVGLDEDFWPYEFPIIGGPSDTSMKVVLSAAQGLRLQTIGKVVRETGIHWVELVLQLEPAEALV